MRSVRGVWKFGLGTMLSGYLAAGASGCSGSNADPTPASVCLDAGVDASCTPAYEPTFDAIYTNTFQRSCTLSGASCHASEGKQAGVDLSDVERGYATLTMNKKVLPGQPACSSLVARVLSTSGKTRMPPGRSLSPGEQCAIVTWIADGAQRRR